MATMTMVRTETRTMTLTEIEEQEALLRHQRLMRTRGPYIMSSVVYPSYAAAMEAVSGSVASAGAPPPPPPGGSTTITEFEEPEKRGLPGARKTTSKPEVARQAPAKKLSIRRRVLAAMKRFWRKGVGRVA